MAAIPGRPIARRSLLAGAIGAAVVGRVAGSAGDAAADVSPDPRDLLDRIARARAHVRTLQGPFTQARTIGLLATEVRSSGRFWLVRPDRLRWELAPPDAVTFWITPEGLAYRDPHGQARIPAGASRWAGALDDLRTLLGGDVARLRDRWDLSVRKDDADGAELEASPRPKPAANPPANPSGNAPDGAPLRSLRLALAPDLVRPTRVTLIEGPRDRTVIDFGPLTVDAPVSEALLRP